MAMGRSSSVTRGAGRSPTRRRPSSTAAPSEAGSTSTTVKGSSPPLGARSAVVTSRRGLAARSTAARSACTSLGFTAAVTAPSLAAAT